MSNSNQPQAKGLKVLSTAIDTAMQSDKTPHELNRIKYKIDVNEVIPKPQIAWSLTNTKSEGEAILGTLGDFGLIIGKAKSRKSFFISIAVSTALGNDAILNRFKSYLPPDKNEVIYFDTEQSKYYVQKAVKRICTQIDQPEPKNLHAFHLRSLNPAERLQFIETEIYSNDKIGFVVIDGIKDLVTSINDESEATMIASKLLKWTEERNIYLVTVLHQNKSDNNARGHIGTELINKAQTVLSVTKAENDTNISIVEPLQCRDIEPEIFAFEINEFGIPVIAENFEIRTETNKNKFDVTNMEDFKKYQLLTEVFSKGESFSYGKLVEQLQIAYKNQFKNSIGINRTKLLITDCSNNDWLKQEKDKAPYTLGAFQVVENDVIF
ncbi:AAA family ATPase [Flavobacterium caseinilyticum]|uniref:Mobilization protein n=1 Tax=Flavobacterium caseinilyticum TaxID=2541732 RepID=A0A4R5ARC6_9FLAO|nr:AAA family ATPase [Flavobacterium caseinilyticum]TDD75263.1 mobilization protein [Flavobacterium caseinilyticum]